MALITSIRKHFWFVLILLGLALASFVIMDIVGSGNGGGGRGTLSLGEVGGETIKYQDFQNTENIYYNNSGSNTYSVRNAVWNYFVEKSIIEKESNEMGLTVGTDELMDLQFGANLSPIIEANWKNQQTQQIDRAKLNEFKQAIETGQPLNPNFRSFWAEQEKQVIKAKLQEKLGVLVSKAIYTPKWMGDQKSALGKDQVTIAYVKVPFDKLTNSVSLTDEDYTNFMNLKKAKYEIDEENRVLEAIVFDVLPTKKDSLTWFETMTDKKLAFQSAENDSLFAISNNGSYANFYFDLDKIPASIKEQIVSMETKDTYGPYVENGAYNVVKLIDKKMIADSVHASHILRSVDISIPGQLEDAKSHIDSIKQMIERGAKFEDIAMISSQDPGSGAKGGDLGFFIQGAMVPSFNEVCFYKEADKLHVVQSRFGIHLIKIHERKFLNEDLKYKLAFLRLAITPSQETQDKWYDDISNLLTNNREVADLNDAAVKLGGTKSVSSPIKLNDFDFIKLGAGQTSRDIIRWAFEQASEVGSIAPEVFTYTDDINYFNSKYVLVSVNQVNSAGMPSVTSMKASLQTEVENYNKANGILSSLGTDMTKIAADYGVKVDTAANISFTSSFVSGIGNEPKVVATAFGKNIGDASSSVVGDNGLYVLKVIDKTEGADVSGLPQFRNSERDNKRREVTFGLLEALKKVITVEDNRSTFF